MLPLWRVIPRVSPVCAKGLFSGVQSVTPTPGYYFPKQSAVVIGNMDSSFDTWLGLRRIEGVQGPLPPDNGFRAAEGRELVKSVTSSLNSVPDVQGVQEDYTNIETENSGSPCTLDASDNSSVYEGLNSHVSLYGCMQSNVPHPTSDSAIVYGSFNSLPGAGGKLYDKFLSAERQQCHPSRHFSTSALNRASIQGAQDFIQTQEEDPSLNRCPQGIHGDDCVRFKLWMENCYRYHLPNCDEQAEAIKSGKKTLAQVFKEQEEIIREVAENYRKIVALENAQEVDAQGVQDADYGFSHNVFGSCPQGIQGEDCDTFRLWAYNCDKFGFNNCQENLHNITTGRRNLKDIFEEQDIMIKQVVLNYQQRRNYSAESPKPQGEAEVGKNDPSSQPKPHQSSRPQGPDSPLPGLSQKDRLKRAVKEYGSTVVVFHVGISLVSLGGFYMAVSSGLDVVGMLTKIGVGEAILQSRIATGASTFVVAYAVHKVFAPVRIAITLSCTPFIVRYLRRIGFLKPPKVKLS